MKRAILVLTPVILCVLVIGCVKSYLQELRADEEPDFEQIKIDTSEVNNPIQLI